jgi:uncharacterized lipoprotein YddW (UPF0748 family)
VSRFVPAFVVLCVLLSCGAPPLPEGDAGVDAGETGDAGGADASVVDAGNDAGAMRDAGLADAGDGDAGVRDGGSDDAGATLVTVGHERELRGVWIASVSNLDWPTSSTLSADAGRASLVALVDSMADAGMNALFFQVRPESDALYASTLEPWSRYLTGTQGRDPGWDPLAELLTLAHARGLEVHAWINPYRGLVSSTSQVATNHVTRTLSAFAVTYDGKVVMNPGAPAVRQHVKAVVSDLLGRYDVDGLHFDDYFYPYPDSANTPFPDAATYQGYQADGGTLSPADWRRENVNALVREVMALVKRDHPQVRFGISPFGIWKSGTPAGITGLSAYDVISCDAVTWMNEGWVDYLAPQLYWPIGGAQDFIKLSSWWAAGTMGGRHLFSGQGAYRLAAPTSWPLSEYRAQLQHLRTLRAQNTLGAIHFRARDIQLNRAGGAEPGGGAAIADGVATLLRRDFHASPALPPPLPRAGAVQVPPVPFVSQQGATLSVTSPLPALVRFFALYREVMPGQWQLVAVRGGAQVSFAVTSGAWAVSAVGRGGGESQGVRLVVP